MSRNPYWAIQYHEVVGTGKEAKGVLAALALQEGYLGGRTISPTGKVIPGSPSGVRPSTMWAVQAFFEAPPDAERLRQDPKGTLPEGCSYVLILPGLEKALGLVG